ncbi:immunoglobulin lambda-1 light chain-like [Boleophthalmus pectinirostris]|uniref:immunoglobulin lambda-1 light chain-like n=1 Tax=Boleophthalmus pectinirostris TaxID=150288 RepID=UPI00242D7E95|nr:immunoglobulin lambda-1 light chain-like [Boleophthalmus pectinirostris]
MLWSLYTLACALTCVSAVTQVTQNPPDVSVERGQSVSMDCNLGYVEDYGAWWYKQSPGQVPQFLLYFYHSSSAPTYGSGVSSSKFTSTHQSKRDYRLTINSLEQSDSAVYYCKTWDNTVNEWVFGAGTRLSVTDASRPPPVVTVFPPSPAQLQSHTVTLLCVSAQSGPWAQVSWLADGSPVSSGVWSSGAVLGAEQTFHVSSSLSIPTSHWTSSQKLYTCRVSLGPQTQPAQDTIRSGVCDSH